MPQARTTPKSTRPPQTPARRNGSAATPVASPQPKHRASYVLEEQVGFLLRQATQRHVVLFSEGLGVDLTPTQWAALSKLEDGPVSQNLLGRQTAMDAATIKGVIDRLSRRGLTATRPDPDDGRRLLVELTSQGRRTLMTCMPAAIMVSEETLSPLTARERETFVRLLQKLR